ncbi:MAG: zinc ribbon domain-containing protein [Candidatus Marsarchaeota archaeon]|nr:zinc ribbon domain-containing protein [Candidatus Marsarchaeota archaeon]MCL5413038.1 zinc ribbon domain-containing protein [Candidatus Marsarchaeota archaeon]
MKRAILLQIDGITAKKGRIPRDFSLKATSEFNRLWKDRDFCNTFIDFHRKTFAESKKRTGFNVQVYASLERAVWRSKVKSKGITVKFNVPRNCKTFDMAMTFIELGIYPRNRIAVPIKKNRNFQRYSDLLKSGWICKTYGLTSRLGIVAYLSKEETELPLKKNVLGVDVNSKCFAVSVISSEGKVLHQDYFGKDIWQKRKKLFERKSVLQSYADTGSEYANRALKEIKQNEHNFVKNRIGEVVREITEMALQYDADISIEDLRRFSPKGRRFNREVMRIPFLTFKQNLMQRCFDKNIALNIVDAWHTSKFCSNCGAVGKGHDSSNYALFRCKKCGVVVNSDRKASLNIAIKSLLERRDTTNHDSFQISNRRVPVNRHIRPDAVVEPIVAVRHVSSAYGKPTGFSLG